MENHFKAYTVEYIERSRNTEADGLAQAATNKMPLSTNIFFQVIEDASVKMFEQEPRLINFIEGED
jgi:hypothetical protein